MGTTSIEWTATQQADGTWTPGYTFNGWIGCEKVSAACKNCYAEHDTYPRVSKARGLPLWGADSARHVTSDAYWRKPLGWNRKAAATGQRAKVFAHSLSDVFEDREDLIPHRARLFRLVTETPWLDWMLLTKRPENADRLWRNAAVDSWDDGYPGVPVWGPNVWLGTTVEDQEQADKRIPHLLSVPAAVRFLSMEPMLGPVKLGRINAFPSPPWSPSLPGEPATYLDALRGVGLRPSWTGVSIETYTDKINLVIVGGESGPKARPFDLDAARSIVADCKSAGVAVFVKQMGELWARQTDTRHIDSHGGDMDLWSSDLRVRQMPTRTP